MKKIMISIVVLIKLLSACVKDEKKDNKEDLCATKNLDFTVNIEDASKCINNGEITINAIGSIGFTYQLSSRAFQNINTIQNLAAGIYNITVKDIDGCEKTKAITLKEIGAVGDKFKEVKALMAQKCAISGCHAVNGAVPNPFYTDCLTVERGIMMKFKSVDNNMGHLSSVEKSIITKWLNAGGRYSD